MIETTEELREYLNEIDADNLTKENIAERSRGMVQILEEVFGPWEEDTLGALLLDVGMILGTKRGDTGVNCLARALEALGALLNHHEFHRKERTRPMN